MLITKFNSMIRNRIVWWIIGGIIIITFVGWFSPRGSCESPSAAGEIAKLDGTPVTQQQLQSARNNQYVTYCLMARRPLKMTPAIQKILAEQSWKRLAALQAARKMGLVVSPEEVLQAISSDPDLQANGAFSRSRYDALVSALGTSKAHFEEILAENILLQKAQFLMSASTWVSPLEMQSLLAQNSDTFRVQYATLGTNIVQGPIEVSEAELRSFYDTHTNLFVIPEQISVRYVAFAVSNRLADARVDSQAVEEYYDTHNKEYTTTDTNGAQNIEPLEKVAASISNNLLHADARQKTQDAATDFVVALTPGRDGTAAAFETVAASSSVHVVTTDLFRADSPPPGIENPELFAEVAFRLKPTPDEYYSDPVTASNYVYVIAVVSNVDARLPDFAEARPDVVPLARGKAFEDTLIRKAREIRNSIESKLGTRRFEELAREQTLNVSTTTEFTVYTAPDALASPEILREITMHNRGELTEPVPTARGLMLVYVADRIPATKDEADVLRSQILTSISRRRTRVLLGEWQDYLIRSGRTLTTNRTDAAVEPPIVD